MRAKVRCVCCVVTFPKFHYNDTTDLLPSCHGLVSDTAYYLDMSRQFAVSLTSPQQVGNFPGNGEATGKLVYWILALTTRGSLLVAPIGRWYIAVAAAAEAGAEVASASLQPL